MLTWEHPININYLNKLFYNLNIFVEKNVFLFNLRDETPCFSRDTLIYFKYIKKLTTDLH